MTQLKITDDQLIDGKIPEGFHWPEGVTELNLESCHDLTTLPDLGHLTTLKKLNVRYCKSLTTEKVGSLPVSLEEVVFSSTELETLPDLNHLANLKKLHATYCTNLTKVGVLPISLEEVDFTSCKKLKILPDLRKLVNLLKINLSYCNEELLSNEIIEEQLGEVAKRRAETEARKAEEDRRQAEEDRRQAELKAKREAELKAKREAEEWTKREAELKAKREAELKAKREAEEWTKREAEAEEIIPKRIGELPKGFDKEVIASAVGDLREEVLTSNQSVLVFLDLIDVVKKDTDPEKSLTDNRFAALVSDILEDCDRAEDLVLRSNIALELSKLYKNDANLGMAIDSAKHILVLEKIFDKIYHLSIPLSAEQSNNLGCLFENLFNIMGEVKEDSYAFYMSYDKDEELKITVKNLLQRDIEEIMNMSTIAVAMQISKSKFFDSWKEAATLKIPDSIGLTEQELEVRNFITEKIPLLKSIDEKLSKSIEKSSSPAPSTSVRGVVARAVDDVTSRGNHDAASGRS